MMAHEKLISLKRKIHNKNEFFLITSFKALGDINRQRIFQSLINEPSLSASKIASTLEISRPLASQHLKILEQAKLFTKEKIGKNIYYRLNKKNNLIPLLTSIIKNN